MIGTMATVIPDASTHSPAFPGAVLGDFYVYHYADQAAASAGQATNIGHGHHVLGVHEDRTGGVLVVYRLHFPDYAELAQRRASERAAGLSDATP